MLNGIASSMMNAGRVKQIVLREEEYRESPGIGDGAKLYAFIDYVL